MNAFRKILFPLYFREKNEQKCAKINIKVSNRSYKRFPKIQSEKKATKESETEIALKE